MTRQLALSEKFEVPVAVAVGAPFPAIKKIGGACGIPGALRYIVEEESPMPILTKAVINNDVKYMANMIMESGIDNWWYLVIGGRSSLKSLIKLYPDTLAKD
jgi:hypothetical protein